jgi:hypothetical protein
LELHIEFRQKTRYFLTHLMNYQIFNIDRLRRSLTLRSITVIVLWIAMFASVPQLDLQTADASLHVQKIIHPDSIPAASPAYHNRITNDYAEFIVVVLSKADIEKHLHVITILDKYLSDHSQSLTRAFIYSQTTSSFL